MNNFEEVVTDIFNSIDSIDYPEKEKKLIKAGIVLNLYKILQNEKQYNISMDILNQNEVYKRTLTYGVDKNKQ